MKDRFASQPKSVLDATRHHTEDIRATIGYGSRYTEAQGDDPAITGEPPEEQA